MISKIRFREIIFYWKTFYRADPLAGVASVVLLMLIILGVSAPMLPIVSPDEIGYSARLTAPGEEVLLGSDNLGRSMFSRILQGIRITFLLSTAAVLIAAIIGTILGLSAAYFRSYTDEVITRVADILFSFPPVLMGLLITAILAPGKLSAIGAIILIALPSMVRVVRAAALDVCRQDYVVIAELLGASITRRFLVHLLPNVAVAIIAQTAYSISVGMLIESALSFLGLGVQPPEASLGSLLREGSAYLTVAPWLVFGPAFFLVIAILSVNLVGDGLRRFVDPIHPRSLGV